MVLVDTAILPKADVVKEYADSVPPEFLFSIKVPNSITLTHHYTKGKGAFLIPNPHFLSTGLMARFLQTSLIWIYAYRRHGVKGRNHFAFSEVRRLVAQAALDNDFAFLCPIPRKPVLNSLVTALLRMAA